MKAWFRPAQGYLDIARFIAYMHICTPEYCIPALIELNISEKKKNCIVTIKDTPKTSLCKKRRCHFHATFPETSKS